MIDVADTVLVRPGDAFTIARLVKLGGRVLGRTERADADGVIWPVAVIQLGGRRGPVVQVVLEPLPPDGPSLPYIQVSA